MPARWTSSAKSGVGTALTASSRLWFTISHGILNEIYYPRVDTACTRDMGLIVTAANGYFSEEKRAALHEINMAEEGVPAFRLVNMAADGRYRIEKKIVTDPRREALLQQIWFEPLKGSLADYRLYVLIAPHLVNGGAGNTGWVGDYKGTPMLFARGRFGVSLALACSVPWLARSVGYVGTSDGWQLISHNGELDERYCRAENGNVALCGEIDLAADGGRALLTLGFGARPQAAGNRALASLHGGFEPAWDAYIASWRAWQQKLLPLDRPAGPSNVYIAGWLAWPQTLLPLDRRAESSNLNTYRVSTAVLATHQAASVPGAAIASLSIPWGFSKGDEDLGGYHLVWPRDLVETAGGFLAAGGVDEAKSILAYLMSIQEADGHWSQNVWLDGEPYWGGVQMDECAFPILLVDMLLRGGHLTPADQQRFLPMVEKAAGYVVRNGPVTSQDRWEEDAGYSPFTLAVEIAALLAAADIVQRAGRAEAARYLRETADTWNDEIEHWTFATGSQLCEKLGLKGYYVRIAPPDVSDAASPLEGFVNIKNRPPRDSSRPASLLISPDALALVRFGVRAADDPRILDTVRAIDEMLRVDLPQGPLWYRYNLDGYGEHEDGAPFDGLGVGRPWPLLAGERAHYELAAGRPHVAKQLLETLEHSSSSGGLLPEQVWDKADIPERELFRGRPAGSAMPLVWAHAEHIKLLRSLRDGQVFDLPPQPVKRYQIDKTVSPLRSWRFNQKRRSIPAGKKLRTELQEPATVHWTLDDWGTSRDEDTREVAFGMHCVDMGTQNAAPGSRIRFTFYWPGSNRWEGTDYTVAVGPAAGIAAAVVDREKATLALPA
jgi:glucoamylase